MDWTSFSTQDPFNNNLVEGQISRHSGDDYGALLIEKVNGEKVSQFIYCTPKIAYPFDRSGNWYWPKAKTIERYEKLDGTNVFAYCYQDASGFNFLSYKTRLLPFIQQSRFGPFLEMWQEMLGRFPIISKLPFMLNMNLSFELWGARNPHLVKYEIPLQASLLFARNGQKIIPPSRLNHGIVQADLRGIIGIGDYTDSYNTSREQLEAELSETEDGYIGTEGEVWYLLDELGNWIMLKCKPNTIEAIHWAAGGIGKNIIRATIGNAFENWDEPTIEQVAELLKEEFSEVEIDKVWYSITRHLQKAIANHEFQEQVLLKYHSLGMNILEDKVAVMRALSEYFQKGEMHTVYSVIWNHIVK